MVSPRDRCGGAPVAVTVVSAAARRARGHLDARQEDAERRALAQLAVDPDMPAALVHDAVHRGEPEPRAVVLGGEEGLEEVRLHVRVHADARIRHLEHHVRARLEPGPRRLVLADHAIGRLDGQAPAIRHGVARIDGEVQEHLLDLAGIGRHGSQVRRGHGDELDRLAEEPIEHRVQVADDAVDVEHGGRQHLLSAEGQKLARERRRLVGGFPGALGMGAERILGGQPPQNQLAVAADDHEQVVEVVRDAPASLPTASIFWAWRSCSSVWRRASSARWCSVRSTVTPRSWMARPLGPSRTWTMSRSLTSRPSAVSARYSSSWSRPRATASRHVVMTRTPIVGMDARHEEIRLSEPVLGAVAEDDLGALAHEREGERAGVGLPHDGVEPLDEVAEALLGGHARGLQALLLAQVLHDQEEAGGILLGHADGGQGDQDGPALLPLSQVQIEEKVALGDARGQHLVGAGDQAVGAHDQGQLAAERHRPRCR